MTSMNLRCENMVRILMRHVFSTVLLGLPHPKKSYWWAYILMYRKGLRVRFARKNSSLRRVLKSLAG